VDYGRTQSAAGFWQCAREEGFEESRCDTSRLVGSGRLCPGLSWGGRRRVIVHHACAGRVVRDSAEAPWNPPNWVFAPVWSALYLMMAVAAWLVWRRAGFGGASAALGLFAAQLIFNVAWSWLFFGLRSPGLAFGGIVVLWVAIVATIVSFARTTAAAAWIMTPYLAWVTFASTLNLAIWRLNG